MSKKILYWVLRFIFVFLTLLSFISYDEYLGLVFEKKNSHLLLLNWFFIIPFSVIISLFLEKNKGKYFSLTSFLLLSLTCYILYQNDETVIMGCFGYISTVNILILAYFSTKHSSI